MFFGDSKKLQLSAYKYANENLLDEIKRKDEIISQLKRDLESSINCKVKMLLRDDIDLGSVNVRYKTDNFSLTGTMIIESNGGTIKKTLLKTDPFDNIKNRGE